jgi:DNA repair protein RadA/Sms
MTVGLDHYRASMLLAVIERKLGYTFAAEDIYLNVAGGIEIDEPAVDLSVVLGVVSCLKNRPVPAGLAAFGEVGLSGEVRSVGQALARVKEAASLGFTTIVLPEGNAAGLARESLEGIRLAGVRSVRQAVDLVF